MWVMEHSVSAGHLYVWRLKGHEMSLLESLRCYFDEWQAQGHETRPSWYDTYIDEKINSLTNVELLELLDLIVGAEGK